MIATPKLVSRALLALPTSLEGMRLLPLTLGHGLLLDYFDDGALTGLLANELAVFRSLFVLTRSEAVTRQILAESPDAVPGLICEFSKTAPAVPSNILALTIHLHICSMWSTWREVKFPSADTVAFSLDGSGLGDLLGIAAALWDSGVTSLDEIRAFPLQAAGALLTASKIGAGAEWVDESFIAEVRHAKEDAVAELPPRQPRGNQRQAQSQKNAKPAAIKKHRHHGKARK